MPNNLMKREQEPNELRRGHRIFTKALLDRFKTLGDQDVDDPIVVMKLFCGQWTWYCTSYNESDRIFFGFVIGLEREWGSFSFDELAELNQGLTIVERDKWFSECKFSDLKFGDLL